MPLNELGGQILRGPTTSYTLAHPPKQKWGRFFCKVGNTKETFVFAYVFNLSLLCFHVSSQENLRLHLGVLRIPRISLHSYDF